MKNVMNIVVKVRDWSRPRLVENRGNAVAMEVARISCSHCSTCSSRIETVAARVHFAGIRVKWERRKGGQLIVIPLPKGKDPITHLNKLLKLGIKRVAIPRK